MAARTVLRGGARQQVCSKLGIQGGARLQAPSKIVFGGWEGLPPCQRHFFRAGQHCDHSLAVFLRGPVERPPWFGEFFRGPEELPPGICCVLRGSGDRPPWFGVFLADWQRGHHLVEHFSGQGQSCRRRFLRFRAGQPSCRLSKIFSMTHRQRFPPLWDRFGKPDSFFPPLWDRFGRPERWVPACASKVGGSDRWGHSLIGFATDLA